MRLWVKLWKLNNFFQNCFYNLYFYYFTNFTYSNSKNLEHVSILKSWFLLRNRPVTLSKSRKRQHRSSSFEGDSTASLGTRHYYGLYPETKHIKMQWNDPATMAYSLKQLPVKHKKMQWNDSATIAYTRK